MIAFAARPTTEFHEPRIEIYMGQLVHCPRCKHYVPESEMDRVHIGLCGPCSSASPPRGFRPPQAEPAFN